MYLIMLVVVTTHGSDGIFHSTSMPETGYTCSSICSLSCGVAQGIVGRRGLMAHAASMTAILSMG